MTGRRRISLALAAALAVLALAACGKKGGPKPPPGQESQYTYPNLYPAPSSVAPRIGAPPASEEAADEDSRSTGPFPYSRKKTTVYGSE